MDSKKIIEQLIKIAENQQKIIEKLVQAQKVSAQPADVQASLEKANLWSLTNQVSSLLNVAGVPDDAAVNISIMAGKGPTINYGVDLQPPNINVSHKLSALLKQNYATSMSNALRAHSVNIETPLTLNWLKF
jgi:flagellar basal body P-ring protein FlgI